jgi:hypothetical protein
VAGEARKHGGGGGERNTKRKEITQKEKKRKEKERKKNAPPTLPKAVTSKLWLVLSMHPRPEWDVQPLVPPIPMPPMLGSGHHFLLLEVEVGEGVLGIRVSVVGGRSSEKGKGERKSQRKMGSGERKKERWKEDGGGKKKQDVPDEL